MTTRRFRDWRPPGVPIVVLLVLALGVVSVLAYQAYRADRQHTIVAERVLGDYARWAASQFASFASRDLKAALESSLVPMACGEKGPSLAVVDAKVGASGCRVFGPVIGAFIMRMPGGEVTSRGEPVPATRVAEILALARAHEATRFTEVSAPRMALLGDDADARAVAFIVRRSPGGAGSHAIGLTVRRGAFQSMFERILRQEPLLPGSLTQGEDPASLVAIHVVDPGGRPIYTSSPLTSAHHGREPLAAELGGLAVEAHLRPEAAGRLIIGGLPRSRLPLLAMLLTLGMGLVAVALVQIRRERELVRLRTDLVAGVSHELRTPLAQIRMFAETLLLGRARSDGERRRSLEIIDQEARRLSGLVDNVLSFSRGDARRGHLVLEPLEVAPIIHQVVEAFRPLAKARRNRISVEVDDEVVATTDGTALRQVLLNLLDNAVKYGPVGQTVAIGLDAVDGRARITVADEGRGIPVEARGRVWEPFARLPRDRESAIAGTGIGLAVVRDLIQRQGGSVEIGTAPGGGALFAVHLPLARPREVDAHAVDAADLSPLARRSAGERAPRSAAR